MSLPRAYPLPRDGRNDGLFACERNPWTSLTHKLGFRQALGIAHNADARSDPDLLSLVICIPSSVFTGHKSPRCATQEAYIEGIEQL